jgi:CBS-domain-containing membrane protein
MQAADIMTLGAATIRPDASVGEAAKVMLQYQVSGLPVVDDKGELVGIITEGDLLRRPELGTERRRPRWLEFLLGPGRLAEEYTHSHGRRVADVMVKDVVTITPETRLDDIVQLMERRGVKRLPVVDGRKVVGIVSRANLLRVLARIAETAPALTADDQAIRERIMNELDRLDWAPRSALNIMVEDGVVQLWGAVADERERQALLVLVENVPGVKRVEDRLALLASVEWP